MRIYAESAIFAMSLATHHQSNEAESLILPAIALGQTGQLPRSTNSSFISEQAALLRTLDPAKIYSLITSVICGKHPHLALQWMRDTGLLVQILPELDATVDFSQEGGRRHKDVWEHTKIVVLQAVPSEEVRWAALLHDIGKVPTRRYLDDGRVTFHGHAEAGVRMFRRGPAKRIAFPPEKRKRIELLILHHLRAGQYDGTWTDAAVRRFAKEMGDILKDLLNLSRADVTSKRPGKRRNCLKMISELSRRIAALQLEDSRPKLLPPGLGNELMQELGIQPGPELGRLRQELISLCKSGEIQSSKSADYYVQVVRERQMQRSSS